jgi:hypothetical protein
MAIILPSGFDITNIDPIDSRFSVANQAARLGFSAANVYEGLIVYQRDNNSAYVLTNTGSYNSEAGWEKLLVSSGSLSITGSLNVTNGITGSLFGTASFAQTSSFLLNNIDLSGSLRLYVSPSGSDTNDGTQPTKPFKTIKAAVESIAINPNPLIPRRYTVLVATGNYTENNPIVVPPGVSIIGDNLRTTRLTAVNPRKDYFHCHDGTYFYGLRFLDLQYPSFAFSFPGSSATGSINAEGQVSSLSIVHSATGYNDGTDQDIGIIIEAPNSISGSARSATAVANIVGGVITSLKLTDSGSDYTVGEKFHVSIPAPLAQQPFISASPYVQNCSSITGPFLVNGLKVSISTPLPYDVNNISGSSVDEQGAGGGISVDGNLVNATSPLQSFVADAFTQVNQGGPGHLVINNGYAQFVSCFTTFCTYAFKIVAGGFANISNSVADFGKYGLISKKNFPISYNTASIAENKTSTVVRLNLIDGGNGYSASLYNTASLTFSGGGGSGAEGYGIITSGSFTELVLTNSGSGYLTIPSLIFPTPTSGSNLVTATGSAILSGVSEFLMTLLSGSRGVDISSNMSYSGSNYLVTGVSQVGGQPNQRRITVFPAPPSIVAPNTASFTQLSNASTGTFVMEYVGSGVTYNALPRFGGIPNSTAEITEIAPGKIFYTIIDNIGNLKVGPYFGVNQLTGDVTISSNNFTLAGVSSIGPFKRNGINVGVVLNEISNLTNLQNSVGTVGQDTVPTQYAVQQYLINQGLTSANTFIGTSSFATSASYALTSSFANNIASGLNITASNLLVTNTINTNEITAVSASFGYVETISGSAVIIGQEYIILNTQAPSARYAGLQIYDSGSNATASVVWDSQTNHFVYENASGSSYVGGGFMAGPRNTGSLADVTYPTLNRVLRGQGGDHLYDSNITDDNTKVSIGINTQITGSLNVSNGITGSLLGTASFANNATSASFAQTVSFINPLQQNVIITGSLTVSGSSIFSGSISTNNVFTGSGAGLFNIPASGITGLNLSQIATGSITASVSTGNNSFTITSGSTNLLSISNSGNSVLSGSLTVTNPSQNIPSNSIFVPTNSPILLYASSSVSQSTSFTIATGSISYYGEYDDSSYPLDSTFYIIAYSNQYHSATSPGVRFTYEELGIENYFIVFNSASVQSPATITGYDIYAFNHLDSTWYRNNSYINSGPIIPTLELTSGTIGFPWFTTSSLLSLPNNPVPGYNTNNTIGIGKSSSLNGILDVNGNTFITGSLNVTQGITGSLFGSSSFATTASFANNATSASFAQTSSFVNPLNQNVTITGSFTVITGSNVEFQVTNTGIKIGNISTDIHTVTGSLNISGSVAGNVTALTISSNTASLDLNRGNFFTLQLVPGTDTHINPSNIKPGQTVNILVSTTGSATVTFPSTVLQPSGFSYAATPTTGRDILTMVSFNTSSLYLANVKNLI